MAKVKTNPRKRPVTQADLNRVKIEAIENAFHIMLYVLCDKLNATHDELYQFAREINYEVDSVNKGYLSMRDIRRVVEDEYDVKLNLK